MLATFLLLEMIDILFFMLVGNMFVFRFVLIMLVFGIYVYDFWDAYRIFFNERERERESFKDSFLRVIKKY